MWVVIVLIVVGLGAVAGGLVISRRSSRLIEERLGIAEEVTAVDGEKVRRSPVADALNRELARRGLGSNLATQLARADLKLTVGEFMAATVILVVAAAALFYFLSGNIVLVFVACLAGFFAPRLYIAFVRSRRLAAFNNQLGDTINLLVNSLRAGYSVLQAMEAVSEEMGPPISVEFGRVVQEVQLGITLEQALGHMLRRITSDDLDMMVTAVNVQREVGGNLAEVLDAISHTIRERVRIKGEIKALSAQSRWSGYLVSLVPVALAGVLYIINPGYIGYLTQHACGWVMIGSAFLGIALGYAAINKIVQIDI